jgi:hypothetical protein
MSAVAITMIARAARLSLTLQLASAALIVWGGVICMNDTRLGYRQAVQLDDPRPTTRPAAELAIQLAPLIEVVRAAPESPQAHYALGRAYYEQRAIDQAAVELSNAFLLDPFDHATRHLLQVLLVTHGIYLEDTEAFAGEDYRRHPDDPVAMLMLVKRLEQRGFPDAARRLAARIPRP